MWIWGVALSIIGGALLLQEDLIGGTLLVIVAGIAFWVDHLERAGKLEKSSNEDQEGGKS